MLPGNVIKKDSYPLFENECFRGSWKEVSTGEVCLRVELELTLKLKFDQNLPQQSYGGEIWKFFLKN